MSKTRIKTILVQEEIFELTREQLLALKSALRGGNAIQDNVALMTEAARGVITPNMAFALRTRALFIERGIEQIDAILWPVAITAGKWEE
jgi:hypothetical protein